MYLSKILAMAALATSTFALSIPAKDAVARSPIIVMRSEDGVAIPDKEKYDKRSDAGVAIPDKEKYDKRSDAGVAIPDKEHYDKRSDDGVAI
ncbi:hypothetical protein MBLNU459_g0409t1, partial [Dothideomycetes sp. NU459]